MKKQSGAWLDRGEKIMIEVTKLLQQPKKMI